MNGSSRAEIVLSARALALMVVSFVACSIGAARAGAPPCDNAMAMRAETEIDALKTWKDLYDSFV